MDAPEIEKDTGEKGRDSKSDYIPGKPYSKIGRELAAEDLTHPAVQKLILNEIDKLEIRIAELNIIEQRFYEIDKQKAILEEKLKTHKSLDLLYSLCLSVGSGLLGMVTLFKIYEYGWIFILLGGVLIVSGILSKYVKWN